MEPLWKVYASRLRGPLPTHAFYSPEPSDEIKPGTVGYIDGSGNWHMLEQIPEAHAGARFQNEGEAWGECVSQGVQKINIQGDAGVPLPTHVPGVIRLQAKYTTNSESGAMLVCRTDVTKRSCRNAHATYRWATENPRERRRQFGEVLLNDFYIVTTTWNTRGTFTVAWQDLQANAGVSFEVEIYKVRVGAGAERWVDESSGAWRSTRINQGERVVGFEGRRFRYTIFLFGLILGVKETKPTGKTKWLKWQLWFNRAIGNERDTSAAARAITRRANELREEMVKLASLPTYTCEVLSEMTKLQEEATRESGTDHFFYVTGDGKIIEFKLQEVPGSAPIMPPSSPLEVARTAPSSLSDGTILGNMRDLSIGTAANIQTQSARTSSYRQPASYSNQHGAYENQPASYNTQPSTYSDQPPRYTSRPSTYDTKSSHGNSEPASRNQAVERDNMSAVNPTVRRSVEHTQYRSYSGSNTRESDKRNSGTRTHTQSYHRSARSGRDGRAPSFVPSDESDDSSEEEYSRAGKRNAQPRPQGTKREVR
ncbi:hypothetical protein PV08_03619 [Exophiala spinifera]|uniref:Uncharacterized protein n=1 Tax=Exophiala spinifera TaxID=91928 RepID=A0A0D2BL56_9EURO|nr:uncharacterized protein PV08_03619 [Exophiala spinifera]KIW19325.1 hypothetical protein PV08_03619 [Exophiala spinifera]